MPQKKKKRIIFVFAKVKKGNKTFWESDSVSVHDVYTFLFPRVFFVFESCFRRNANPSSVQALAMPAIVHYYYHIYFSLALCTKF